MNKKIILALLFTITVPTLKAADLIKKEAPKQTIEEALQATKEIIAKKAELNKAKKSETKTTEEKTAKNASIEKLKEELKKLPTVSYENKATIEKAIYSFTWKSFGYSCAKYASIVGLTALVTYLISNKSDSNFSAGELE